MNPSFQDIPELTPINQSFVRVLRAAVNGKVPDEAPQDWSAIINLAYIHHLSGFLYLAVCTWAPCVQPDATLMAHWRVSFLRQASTYTRVSLQAHDLLTALREAGIRVIPLKGIWLAERIYEDGACRPMCDIDLLVPGEELAQARQALERLGYTTDELYLSDTNNKHVRYQKTGEPLPVELHWHLWHAETKVIQEPDLKQVWMGLLEEHLHGALILAFPPERQLIHLTQHILQHALTVPLNAYLDLVLLCRHYAGQLDLSRVEEEARVWHVSFGAKFVLQLAFDIFEVSPPATLNAFSPKDNNCKTALQTALCATIQLNCENRGITHAVAAFCQESWAHRFRLVLARIFCSPSELRQRCPTVIRRFGLAGGYLWRVGDLIRRYNKTLRKVSIDRHAVDTSLSNFSTRQMLSQWLCSKETQDPRFKI
jgi:hypothetical protein